MKILSGLSLLIVFFFFFNTALVMTLESISLYSLLFNLNQSLRPKAKRLFSKF